MAAEQPDSRATSRAGACTASSTTTTSASCGASSRRRPEPVRANADPAEDRRLLRRVHGRGGDRRAGIAPLQPDLARDRAAENQAGSRAARGDLHARAASGNMLFGSGAEQDARDATKMIAARLCRRPGPARPRLLRQGRREVRGDPGALRRARREALRAARRRRQRPHRQAKAVMRIETALAKASLTRVERRDPYKIYHRETLDRCSKIAPVVRLGRYFASAHLAPSRVAQRGASPRSSTSSTPGSRTSRWTISRPTCAGTLLAAAAPYLSKAFVDEDFAFYRAYLRGREGAAAALEELRRPGSIATSARRSGRNSSSASFRPRRRRKTVRHDAADRGRDEERASRRSTG